MAGRKCDNTPELFMLKEKIRERWDQGVASGLIAEELGVTRNTVMGHVARMKLGKRTTCVRKAHYKPPKRIYNVKTKSVETVVPEVISRSNIVGLVNPHRAPVSFVRSATSEPSKNELRRQLREALELTAKMPRPVLTSEGS